jgi:hypothetical protein
MKRLSGSVLAAAILVAACTPAADNRQQEPAESGNDMLDLGPVAEVALGLTDNQLREANLLDVNGQPIGNVEAAVRDSGGTATHLLVEIEDRGPARYVHVPLVGLEAVRVGDQWHVRSGLTRERLLALTEAAPPERPASGGSDVAALGLTERQLRDAGVEGPAAGRDIGTVQGVVRDATGSVTHLVVRIEGGDGEQRVELPLQNLEAVNRGEGWKIRTNHTVQQLRALPAARG